MNLTTTVLFYLIVGAGVAAAVHLNGDARGMDRWFRTFTALVFWPLYIPVVLQGTSQKEPVDAVDMEDVSTEDEIASSIRQVESELDLALNSLDDWSDSVLARQDHRFVELKMAWHGQAQKIRELNRLLDQPAFLRSPITHPHGLDERVAASERGRLDNIARLHSVRDRLHEDLVNTLARVRELVTMIHLAKYTGAPAARTEELVLQIATAVEGLTEVASWSDEQIDCTAS